MPADLFAGPEDEAMAPETEQPQAPRAGADTPEPAAQDKPAAPAKTAKSKAAPAKDAPGFEESFTRLEALVADLERGELPLEKMLDKFEEGVQLVRHCQAFLKQAQLRVSQYVEQRDGRWVLKDLDVK